MVENYDNTVELFQKLTSEAESSRVGWYRQGPAYPWDQFLGVAVRIWGLDLKVQT